MYHHLSRIWPKSSKNYWRVKNGKRLISGRCTCAAYSRAFDPSWFSGFIRNPRFLENGIGSPQPLPSRLRKTQWWKPCASWLYNHSNMSIVWINHLTVNVHHLAGEIHVSLDQSHATVRICSPGQLYQGQCHPLQLLGGSWFVARKIPKYVFPGCYPIGSMYAIYGNIYHQYTPQMLAYIPYMDPMGIDNISYVIDISRFPTVPLFRSGVAFFVAVSIQWPGCETCKLRVVDCSILFETIFGILGWFEKDQPRPRKVPGRWREGERERVCRQLWISGFYQCILMNTWHILASSAFVFFARLANPTKYLEVQFPLFKVDQ